jgi:hypothetical protein
VAGALTDRADVQAAVDQAVNGLAYKILDARSSAATARGGTGRPASRHLPGEPPAR